MQEYKMINYIKTYEIPEYWSEDHLVENAKKVLDEIISKSKLINWLHNWPMNKTTGAGYYSSINFFGFLKITPFEIEIRLQDDKLFPFVNDSNDLEEWKELLESCWLFSKLMIKELISDVYDISDEPPRVIYKRLNNIKEILNTLDSIGDKYHLIFSSTDTYIKTESELKVVLEEGLGSENSQKVNSKRSIFSNQSMNPISELLLEKVKVTVNDTDSIENFAKTYKNSVMVRLFTESKRTEDAEFDSKSDSYNVDLRWNNIAKNLIRFHQGYFFCKSCDGFIAQSREDKISYFRRNIDELTSDLGISLHKNISGYI